MQATTRAKQKVYIDIVQKKIFHMDPHCSGIKNPIQTTWEDATTKIGANPCKKCIPKDLL